MDPNCREALLHIRRHRQGEDRIIPSHGRQISIRMRAFDDDPGIEPQFHTYVGSRAPWDHIADNLPQYDSPRT